MDITIERTITEDIFEICNFLSVLKKSAVKDTFSAIDTAERLLSSALGQSMEIIEHRVATAVDVLAILDPDGLALEKTASLIKWFREEEDAW